MIKGKMAEIMALAIVLGALDKHSGKDSKPTDDKGEFDGRGALAGLGNILAEGFKDMPTGKDETNSNVPNLAKEFHKMGMGVDLMGFAIDVGLLKEYPQEQVTETFAQIENLKGKLDALAAKITEHKDAQPK